MFNGLPSVPDQQLLDSTDRIIVEDRKLTLRLLEHLHAVDRRKLYLKLGFGSMFKYCTKHQRMSEPDAVRKIRTARCVARFPQLIPLLESGDVSLTTVTMASKYIKPDNCDATIEGIKNKSTREVQRFLAGYEPLAAVPADRVRLIVVAKPPSTAVVLPRLPVAASIAESTAPAQTSVTTSDAAEAVPVVVPSVTETAMRHSTISADGKFSSTVEQSTPTKVQEAVAPPSMQFERRARVEFTAHEELLAKLDRVRSLMSHRLPINAPLEELFRFMADYVLQREDPEARQERREARAQSGDVKEPKVPSNPRQIPASVRDQIFVRDKRCTYVGPDGKRCESTHVLQVDHVKPVARRGAATIDNLRLLCAYHNRMESERLMGKRQVIRESRTGYAIMRSAAVG